MRKSHKISRKQKTNINQYFQQLENVPVHWEPIWRTHKKAETDKCGHV